MQKRVAFVLLGFIMQEINGIVPETLQNGMTYEAQNKIDQPV
jgi:hypothetical protein